MNRRWKRLGGTLAALLIIGSCVLVAWLAAFAALAQPAAAVLPTKLDSLLSADYSTQPAGAPALHPLDDAIKDSVAEDERALLSLLSPSGDSELVFAPIFLADRGNQEPLPSTEQADSEDDGQAAPTAARSPAATAGDGKPSPTATVSPKSTPTPKPKSTSSPLPTAMPQPTEPTQQPDSPLPTATPGAPTANVTATATPKPAATGVPPTPTPKPDATAAPPTPTPAAPKATSTAVPTNTPKPTNTPRPTDTPKPTNTPRPTNTPQPPTSTPTPSCSDADPTTGFVLSVTPPDGATGVSPTTTVVVQFDQAMNPATINTSTLVLSTFQSGSPTIPAEVGYDPGTHRATLQPQDALAAATRYRMKVMPNVENSCGTAQNLLLTTFFTTEG